MDFILTRKSILAPGTLIQCINLTGSPCKYAGIEGRIVACDFEEKEDPEDHNKFINPHYWIQYYKDDEIVPRIIEVPAVNVDVVEYIIVD